MTAGLELQDVALSLQGRRLFHPVSLTVAPGEVVALAGPSGCGKSSLLLHLCGLRPTAFTAEGRVLLDGAALDPLPPERRRLGLLLQEALLFPHLTVGENLALALPRRRGEGRKARCGRIEQALERAALRGFRDRDPASLSGGQRARVALLRTLLAEPRALLLDEPFAGLDPPLRRDIRQLVVATAAQEALPVLLATHDLEDLGSVVRCLTLAGELTTNGAVA